MKFAQIKGICNELALYDINENELKGELLDLQEGLAFKTNIKVMGSTDPNITENSHIIVIAAGKRQKPGEGVENLLEKNLAIFKGKVNLCL